MSLPIIFAVILFLITINGFYVAAEFSAVSARRARLAQLADEGNLTAQSLLTIFEDPQKLDLYISTCQLGITIASLTLGFFGQSSLVTWLEPQLARLGAGTPVIAQLVAATTILLLLTMLQVILGELIPKNIGLRYPERLAILTAGPMRWSRLLFRPLIALLNGSAQALLRLLGVRAISEHAHVHSPEEIMMLVEESSAGGVLNKEERRLLVNTLQLRHVTARRVMIPRNRMLAASVDQPIREIFDLLADSTYSRLPLYEESIDKIVGIVHLKDLLLLLHQQATNANDPVGDQARAVTLQDITYPVLYVPDSTLIEDVMVQLQRNHHNLAVVIDEYGGTAGMLALEDLVEEIIGEFQDEFDATPPAVHLRLDDRVYVRGDVDVDQLNELLGNHLPSDAANTIGGLMISQLGHVPGEGEEVQIKDIIIRIEKMDQNSVTEVSIAISPEQVMHLQEIGL